MEAVRFRTASTVLPVLLVELLASDWDGYGGSHT